MDEQLASCSGVVLRKQGNRLRFFALDTNALSIAAFVLALLGVLLGVNGLVQLGLALAGKGDLLLVGAILAALGGAAAYGAVACWRTKAARTHKPSSELPHLATLDLDRQVLCDSAGNVVAKLSDIRFETRFQMGSSSRRLVVCWSSGELRLVDGTPFGGGLWAIQAELERHGFRVQ